MRSRQSLARRMATTCALMLAVGSPAFAQQSASDRLERGEEVMRTLNAGKAQPTLESLRRDFPFLADAITGYALGDVWGRSVLDHRTRQIAAVAAFAALGHRPFMKIHAGYALNLGVTAEELKEVVYLTTVHAGFPRAIEAGRHSRSCSTNATSKREVRDEPNCTGTDAPRLCSRIDSRSYGGNHPGR
jgi:4-carboxymuconolactone decarboxylase